MVSTSSTVATPSSTIEVASFSSTYWRRLSTMPGVSATWAPSQSARCSRSLIASMATWSVASPATSSTPGMNGIGLEKCTVRKRSGFVTAGASTFTGMVEVLVPMIASGRAAAETRPSTSCLTSGSSKTASSMKSASATASSMVLPAERFAAIFSACPAGMRPCSSEARASETMRSSAASAASTLTSASWTGRPAAARTWAMPPPM